jgi:hypothetical protein
MLRSLDMPNPLLATREPEPEQPDVSDLLARIRALQAENAKVRNALADHLRRLPEDAVAEVVAIIISEMPCMPNILGMELKAFAESRSTHDARRVANALRHTYGQPGLAAEVEDILP